jgi:hypothetical protein
MRFLAPNPEEFEELKANGGLMKDTLKKRAAVWAKFLEFCDIFKFGSFEEILEKGSDLDSIVAKFFQHAHVGKEGQEILPKKNTLEGIKSNLKAKILSLSGNKADITDKVNFPVTQVSFNLKKNFHNHYIAQKNQIGSLCRLKNWLGLYFRSILFITIFNKNNKSLLKQNSKVNV